MKKDKMCEIHGKPLIKDSGMCEDCIEGCIAADERLLRDALS